MRDLPRSLIYLSSFRVSGRVNDAAANVESEVEVDGGGDRMRTIVQGRLFQDDQSRTDAD